MTPTDMLIRLALACLFGLIVGAERQSRHKVAGLRTHILVSLGSCLVMILSIQIVDSLPGKTGDPGRMAAQVVSGIGFLGAGAILKEGVTVIGLTTAASLWLIAAIGLATGAGEFFSASIATAFGCLTLLFMGRFDSLLLRKNKGDLTVIIESLDEQPPSSEVSCLLASWGATIQDITILESEPHFSSLSVSFTSGSRRFSLPDLLEEIKRIPNVTQVKKN